jgi:hypothetical protein
MTTPSTFATTDLQQLTQAVAGLTEALARSERRHARLGRMVRWGSVATVSLLIFGGFLVADRLGTAHAQDQSGFPQATSAVEALNDGSNG